MRDDFAAFILTHGRPENVYTWGSLRRAGYRGRIYLVLDDEDQTRPEYEKRYGAENILTFSKAEIAATFDQADNFTERRTIFYARNATWRLAADLNLRYVWQLDDDYTAFTYRRVGRAIGAPRAGYHAFLIRDLERVLENLLTLMKDTPITSIAMSQGGDHFGGVPNTRPTVIRKAMNTFILDVTRPFPFPGRINEDVTAYVLHGSRGRLYFTYMPLQITQRTTQMADGGMSDVYRESGTYLKSFYTVMHAPSCVTIYLMGYRHKRLHHRITWDHAVPKILHERHRAA